MMIIYVHRAISLERKGCNVLVTTRDKKLCNHIDSCNRGHVTSSGSFVLFCIEECLSYMLKGIKYTLC
mgnify:CR=1 FL=1